MTAKSDKKGRTKTEEIIRILRASEGMRVDDICLEYGVSSPTYHRWKKQYGGLSADRQRRAAAKVVASCTCLISSTSTRGYAASKAATPPLPTGIHANATGHSFRVFIYGYTKSLRKAGSDYGQ